jgi:hypothetical protein
MEPKGAFQLMPGCTVSEISTVRRDGKKESSPQGKLDSAIKPVASSVLAVDGKESSKSSKKEKSSYYVFKVAWPGYSRSGHELDSVSEQGVPSAPCSQSPSSQKTPDARKNLRSTNPQQSTGSTEQNMYSPADNSSPTSATGSTRNGTILGQCYSEDLDETSLAKPARLKQRHSSGASLKLHKRAPSKDFVLTRTPSLQRRQTAAGALSPAKSVNLPPLPTRNISNTQITGTYNQASLAALTANAIQQHKKQHRKHVKKRIVQGSGLVAAAGAAAAATVLTAGVGLAAGLTFVGITAAAGGSGAVASRTYMKTKKTLATTLVLAASTAEEAQQWRKAILHAIDSYLQGFESPAALLDELSTDESMDVQGDQPPSTWANLFALDGHNPASALIPNSMLNKAASFETFQGDDSSIASFVDLGTAQRGQQGGTSWRPVEGGWASLLGMGCSGLRIFEEDTIDSSLNQQGRKTFSKIVSVKGAYSAIFQGEISPFPILLLILHFASYYVGRSCPLLKAQAILDASPINAFMCMMSHTRVGRDGGSSDWEEFSPLSSQRSSFRIIEKVDDHTDVIHVVFRPLYLFPSWTSPRDFCVMRYWRLDDDGCYVLCYDSVKHRECPPTPSYVRGDMHGVSTLAPMKQTLRLRHGGRSDEASQCMLTHMVQTDPKGWVPTWKLPMFASQGYADAFGVSSLMQVLDLQDALNSDRFVSAVSAGEDHPFRPKQDKALYRTVSENISKLHLSNSDEASQILSAPSDGSVFEDANDAANYDYAFCAKEIHSPRVNEDKVAASRAGGGTAVNGAGGALPALPDVFFQSMWAEPDANSFILRDANYLSDKKKMNAGKSIFRLMAVDFVETPSGIKGLCAHPGERLQIMFKREKMGGPKAPAFVFAMNILLPGAPNHQMMVYFATDNISDVDGSSGAPSSILCKKFFFGDSDEYRDNTFKLIPAVVEGNFMVRKAVGATPAIMGTKLKQYYTSGERFFEIYLDVASSSVAAGVVRVVKGYVRSVCLTGETAVLMLIPF